jgi:adenylate kinase family enzyme
MQRVMIIGNGGSGKSTLARELGRRLNLPVIHLDREFWRPGWVRPPHDDWEIRVRELAASEQWIIEGNFGRTQEIRMARADTIILLDFSGWRCIWRAVSRSVRTYGRVRPDLAPGCPEQLPELQFLLWIWRFRRVSLPPLLERISRYRDRRSVHVLTNSRSVKRFLMALDAPAPSGEKIPQANNR